MAGFFQRLIGRVRPEVYHVSISYDDPVAVDMDLAAIYRTQPNLQAVISYISDNIAQLSVKVYDRVDDTDRQRVNDSPAAYLMRGPVNPDMTAYEYKRALLTDMCLYGRHIDIVFPDAGMPGGFQIRPVPVPWVEQYTKGSAYAPGGIIIDIPGGDRLAVEAGDFIMYHTYDPSSPSKALSPVSALRSTLAEQIEAERYRAQVWKRGGRVSSVVSRPKDVQPFTPDQRERFMETLKTAWTGDWGERAGGLMLLEDGMTISPYQVSAHEAQWAEAKKLSREDVAAVFHINPKSIWPGEGQTYASAKDNARAFYADAIAPLLKQIEDRMNAFLLPMLGEPAGHYVEFDISGKLRGSFEEQAQVLTSAVGGPFMVPNEARALMNLPSLGPAFDAMYVPLNMGQVSETGEPVGVYAEDSAQVGTKVLEAADVKVSRAPVSFKAHPEQAAVDEMTAVFRRFYERQAKSVLPKIGAAKADTVNWWNAERWDAELAEDLFGVALRQNVETAQIALEVLGYDIAYGEDVAAAFIRAMCAERATLINDVTFRQLLEAIAGDAGDGILSTPAGVFQNAVDVRAPENGQTFATTVDGFSAVDAASLAKRETGDAVTKTWVHTPSAHPRPYHAAMNGETVDVDGRFSNGMQWPGDWSNGHGVDEIANCHCEMQVNRP